MKKIVRLFAIFAICMVLILTGNVYADSLDTIDVETDKTTVRPGEEVIVTIQFGQDLGAYTFDTAYDKNIFEYVSAEGGTANDMSDKVRVVYHDSTGGTNPRNSMSVTFRAKANITTSNPTEFTVTGEGLANADASVTFDDITVPIVKNVTVEPAYQDYTLSLTHTGDIIKGKEIPMEISYSSPMGRYYEHARLVAEATTPKGATVQLLATDNQQLEHDIIQSGWGDAQGYKIGGKDVSQVLKATGVFSDIGDYTITLKLIDRDSSDKVIAEDSFKLTAKDETQISPPVNDTEKPEEKPEEMPEQTPQQNITQEEMPSELPKTGSNIYIPIMVVLIALISSYVYYNRKKNK